MSGCRIRSRITGSRLPLGGAEVTMEDLVRLYATLANGGRLQPLRRLLHEPPAASQRLLSPEAAFLTLEMLGQIPRPGMTYTDSSQRAQVFWKTGTSHGFRDAWSVAVFDRYVLAVWVGNFDGRRNPAFIGRTGAAPLLFQMIDGLRASRPSRAEPHLPPPGSNLKRVEFCSVSGQLPGPSCPHRTESWFIPGISPITTCDVHREVLVDAATGLRVDQDDGTRVLKREIYEFWSSDLLALFERAGVPRKLPPPFLPAIGNDLLARGGHAPKITLRLRYLEVRGNRQRPRNDELPIGFIAEETAGELGHLLDLPVDTAERLGHICIERALVVAEHRQLMNQELQLRDHQPVVDQVRW